jgi:hypothetical protein
MAMTVVLDAISWAGAAESLLPVPLLGSTPVEPKPRYQEPMSVRSPSLLRKTALGPTLDVSERKAPK